MRIQSLDKQFIEYGDRDWFHEVYNLSGSGLRDQIVKFLNKSFTMS